mmetsp:Transcript_43161/g.138815  ORF Transcript_43161/g.138815 Transcript_43161/m.138815 type:complete len:144 (-) Transcript_43161:208-639(-)
MLRAGTLALLAMVALPLARSMAAAPKGSFLQQQLQESSLRMDTALEHVEASAAGAEAWLAHTAGAQARRRGEFVTTLAAMVPLLIFIGASTWVYLKHKEMTNAGIKVKVGLKSAGCCCLFCIGFGSPLSLCFPIDEDVKDEVA